MALLPCNVNGYRHLCKKRKMKEELFWRKCKININSKKENDQFTIICVLISDQAVWNLQGQSLPSQGEHGLPDGGEEKITNQYWSYPRQNCTTPPVWIFLENVKNVWINPNRTKCSLDPSRWHHTEPWSTTTIILGPNEYQPTSKRWKSERRRCHLDHSKRVSMDPNDEWVFAEIQTKDMKGDVAQFCRTRQYSSGISLNWPQCSSNTQIL